MKKTAKMASFNFDKFDKGFKMRQMFKHVSDAPSTPALNPANVGERLITLELRTPLHRLMEKLSMVTERAIPGFNFDLKDTITIEEVRRMCIQRQLDGRATLVNLTDMIVTAW